MKTLRCLAALLALSGAQLLSASNAAADGWWTCDNQPLIPLVEQNLSGRGTICTTPGALLSGMHVGGLSAGDAYTVWWVYIDDPTCTADPDPMACFAGDDPAAVFGRMDGAVAKHRPRTRFSGHVRDFKPSPGSQVWLLVFGHGPADDEDNRHRARQLLTPEDPAAGAPHLGVVGAPEGHPAGVVVFTI